MSSRRKQSWEAACARWQPPPAHRRKVRYRLTVAPTAPRCRGPQRKHTNKRAHSIFTAGHICSCLQAWHGRPTPMSPLLQLTSCTGKMRVHHHHVTGRLSARDSAMRRGHQNKTWTPGQGILPAFSTMSARPQFQLVIPSHLQTTFNFHSKYNTAYDQKCYLFCIRSFQNFDMNIFRS